MAIEYIWDERKAKSNAKKHGVEFEAVYGFIWDFTLNEEDTSVQGEQRFRAIGPIGEKLYFLCWKEEGKDIVRVISLREAKSREARRWRNEYQ